MCGEQTWRLQGFVQKAGSAWKKCRTNTEQVERVSLQILLLWVTITKPPLHRIVIFSTNKQKNGQWVYGTYAWKPCELEMGGFALDLTHLRPPIRWWSCHSRVLTQGEISKYKRVTCIPAWQTSFSSTRMCEEATARHRRVSPLLPGKSTHTTQAALIPGQDLTLLPSVLAHTVPSMLPVCLLTGNHMQAGFHGKTAHFKAMHCLTPACLSSCPCIPFEGWEADSAQ